MPVRWQGFNCDASVSDKPCICDKNISDPNILHSSLSTRSYPDNLAARIRLLRSESDGICTGLPLHDALRHAWTVANAILLIHNAGLVWETCKPANVLLDEYDGAVITGAQEKLLLYITLLLLLPL